MEDIGYKARGLPFSVIFSNPCLCPEMIDSMYRDVNEKIAEVDNQYDRFFDKTDFFSYNLHCIFFK